MAFESMCREWAKGRKAFRKAVLKDHADKLNRRIVKAEAKEIREPAWEQELHQSLECLGKAFTELHTDKKGASWKVALARHLRERLIP